MDKAKNLAKSAKSASTKGLAKGGWHPPGDPTIHRETWKSDIKGIAKGGKKPDKSHYENAMGHQSAPLGSLKDPESFGPPPRHKEFYDEQGNSLNPVTPAGVSRYTGPEKPPGPERPKPSGGWGTVVPTPNRQQQEQEEQEQMQQEEEARAARGPYKTDTTGLRTDNLPAPPLRRDAPPPAPPPRSNGSPASLPIPQRQPQARAAPPPTLPPRMNEHPDEYTPPPPPSYNEAVKPAQPNPAALNTGAINNLSQAGVSVPGFGIGGNPNSVPQTPTSPTGHSGQLSELQQRFARMNAGASVQPAAPASPTSSSAAAAAAHKKPPPPPPPKKPNLAGTMPTPPGSSDGTAPPPPLPMASKPRPN